MREETTQSTMTETAALTPATLQIQPERNGRQVWWILLSVVVGFLLPVCSCALLLIISVASLGLLGSGPRTTSTGVGDAVAIVRVEGTITSGDADEFLPGAVSGVVIDDLKAAAADPTVKAIVLRVDSPGGTVTGSAQIHEAILELEKPVVVSMGSLAASGGYYVSAPADYIFARADTFTGSVGVILTLYNADQLIEEIGVEVINITSGPNKAIGSPWEDLTPEQQQIFQELIDESFNDFVRVVADGRGMAEEDVRQLADGRIYSGRQAVVNGLADALGNLQDAIDKAAELGSISGRPRIVEYEHLPTFSQLFSGVTKQLNSNKADQALEIIHELTTPSLEYRYVGPGS